MYSAVFLLLVYVFGYGLCSSVPLQGVNDWGGRFQGSFMIPIKEQTDGWEVVVTFSEPVTGFSVRHFQFNYKSFVNFKNTETL